MYGDGQMVHRESRIKLNSIAIEERKRYFTSLTRIVKDIYSPMGANGGTNSKWRRSKNLKTNCFANYGITLTRTGEEASNSFVLRI